MALVAVLARRVGEFELAGHVETRLERHGAVGFAGREAGKVGGEQGEAPFLGIVAPEEEAGVRGVVVRFVERLEGLVGELGDDFGVAAGIEAVGHVREQGLLGVLGQHGVGRGVHALHLVVDHSLVAERAFGAVGLDVPAFLLEAFFVDAGEEHGVEVDVHEVVEVLKIGAGDRIAGLVREGEGVQKGLERPFEQFDEGFLHGVFFGAAQDGMFEDVGDAGGVFRGGAERGAEAFVFVAVEHGKEFRSRGLVTPELDGSGHFGKLFLAYEGKTVGIHSCLLMKKARETGASPRDVLPLSGAAPGALRSVHTDEKPSRPAARRKAATWCRSH